MTETKINSAGKQQPVDKKSRYAKMSTAELKEQQTIDLGSKQKIVKSNSVDKNVPLTDSEWRRYYNIIGLMKAGTVRERKVKGGRWVILNVDVESDGTRTPARLILDNGRYISPKVKMILTFETDDDLYDYIDD